MKVFLDLNNSTRSVDEVLKLTILESSELMHHATQTPAHVVLAFMVRPDVNPAGRELKKQGGNLERARTLVRSTQEPFVGKRDHLYFSRNLEHVFERALNLAREEATGRTFKVRTDQLLRAIIEEQDPDTEKLFRELGINQWVVQAALKRTSGSED